MSIYLSAVSGSRDLEGSAIDKAITAMAIRLTQLRGALKGSNDVTIDLTLMLPGKTQKPDFDGMRMTRFSSDERALYIESAVPQQMLHSQHAERYVSALIQDAIDNAVLYFDEQGVPFEGNQWHEILHAKIQ